MPAATADYYFQSSLESSLGTAPDLVEVERGSSVFTVDGRTGTTVLRFAGGGGLALAPTTRVVGSSEYTIEVLFRLDLLAGYRKIIDFREGAADAGLYLLDGCLTFLPREQDALTKIGSDSYVQIVLTRDAADRVVGYVDGVRQFAFNDRGGLAKVGGSDGLRFFVDDATTTGEHSSGCGIADPAVRSGAHRKRGRVARVHRARDRGSNLPVPCAPAVRHDGPTRDGPPRGITRRSTGLVAGLGGR